MRMTHALISIATVLLTDPDARHFGYDLGRRAGVRSGVLYPLLARMLAEGWLKDEWESAGDEPLGRPNRRYYEVTEAGIEQLGALLQRAQTDARFRQSPLATLPLGGAR